MRPELEGVFLQLSLNSLGSCFFSLTPNAIEDLLWYGLEVCASRELGRAFSSLTSTPLGTGFREVKGIRNGGMTVVDVYAC